MHNLPETYAFVSEQTFHLIAAQGAERRSHRQEGNGREENAACQLQHQGGGAENYQSFRKESGE